MKDAHGHLGQSTVPLVTPTRALGLGTLGTTYLVTCTTQTKARAARLAALRAERKDAIREFLEAAQLVEQAADQRFQTGELPSEMVNITHCLWFKEKCVEIVAEPQLRAVTEAYAWRVGVEAAYRDLPDGLLR